MTVTDLDQRLAKWKPVECRSTRPASAPRERQMVEKLVEARSSSTLIFWRQSDPEGLALYQSTRDPKLRRLLMINGSRCDLLDENKPFVGDEPVCRPDAPSIPKGLTRDEIEAVRQGASEKRRRSMTSRTRSSKRRRQ